MIASWIGYLVVGILFTCLVWGILAGVMYVVGEYLPDWNDGRNY